MNTKIIINKDDYFIKEYKNSYMFKAPEPYQDYIFFYNRNFIKELDNGKIELEANNEFLVKLLKRDKTEHMVSFSDLKGRFEAEELRYGGTWSIEKQRDDVLLLVGNDNEEYLVGNKSCFQIIEGTDTYKVLDKEKLFHSELYDEAVFYFENTNTGVLSEQEESAYILYLDNLKNELGIEAGISDWYEYAMQRNEWKKENRETLAKEKIAKYVNDKAYEKSIPYALRNRKQFIVWTWKFDAKTGKATKVPLKPWDIKKGASSSDSSHWATFDKCCDVINKYGEKYNLAGIGIMFGKGLMGIDFDHCIKNGVCEEEKAAFVDRLDSYTEVSPSGDGLHILVFGKLPKGCKNRNDEAGVEMYDSGRFFTLTGKPFQGKIRTMKKAEETEKVLNELAYRYLKQDEIKVTTPIRTAVQGKAAILSDEKIIELIRKSVRKDTFAKLFDEGEVPLDRNGRLNISCMRKKNYQSDINSELSTNEEILKYYEKDHSSCDVMLCGIIASYTDDAAQIDRIYRKSALMRDKWDSMRGGNSYGQNVCNKVLQNVTWKYTGKPKFNKSINTDVAE